MSKVVIDLPADVPVFRHEDMSPSGRLQLLLQPDGDILVTVMADDGSGSICDMATVEFCSPGMGGGQSRRTHAALRELMRAMIEDCDSQSIGYSYD